MILVCYTHF